MWMTPSDARFEAVGKLMHGGRGVPPSARFLLLGLFGPPCA